MPVFVFYMWCYISNIVVVVATPNLGAEASVIFGGEAEPEEEGKVMVVYVFDDAFLVFWLRDGMGNAAGETLLLLSPWFCVVDG